MRIGEPTHLATAARALMEKVDLLLAAAGGCAWLEDNPMQRIFRAVHITASHAYTDYDLCSQGMGREQMGLAPAP